MPSSTSGIGILDFKKEADLAYWKGEKNLSFNRYMHDNMDFVALLNDIVNKFEISDIFLQTGWPIMIGLHGKLTAISYPLKETVIQNIIEWITNKKSVIGLLMRQQDYDDAFSIDDPQMRDNDGCAIKHRFRINITSINYEGNLGFQIAMRYIKSIPPTIESIGLEEEIVNNLDSGMGSVIFTGSTGSGKTSSIAAAIRYIMEGHTSINGNIITYEWPIEYTFDKIYSSCCMIAQTEINRHLKTFAEGVRNSLRRKPALIMIGELRDSDTILSAVEAANNGHPIFTTTHANGVGLTFKRLFEKFPASQQEQAFYSLLATTNMVVAQHIVPTKKSTKEKPDYTCLREWLVLDNSIRSELENAGLEKHEEVIRSMLKDYDRKIARSMLSAVKLKWQNGIISTETALSVLRNYGIRGVNNEDILSC